MMPPRERNKLVLRGRLRPIVRHRYPILQKHNYFLYLGYDGLIGVSDCMDPPRRWTILERGLTQGEAERKFGIIYDLERTEARQRLKRIAE